ncbi:signal peptidase I [Streptomyces sannanensis]|uniref:Signal peptidase I n=1 Tax=Streptomyces sannanensis TaxID=285536 RepID=A0ABP6SHB4_9ACTN
MDTEAQSPERDRSPGPPSGAGEGSRFLRFSRMKLKPLLAVTALLSLLLLVTTFVVQPFQIPSGSMEPTLQVGDRVLVNKLAYRFGSEPLRGDVVVFDGEDSFEHSGPASDYIKRVVGVGGDRVVCCDQRGRVRVNGQALDEEYIHPGDVPSQVPFDIVVPRGTLWVMGDHRSRSSDSRDHLGEPGGGMVPLDRVVGRADWIGWPSGRWGAIPSTSAFAAVRNPDGAHG